MKPASFSFIRFENERASTFSLINLSNIYPNKVLNRTANRRLAKWDYVYKSNTKRRQMREEKEGKASGARGRAPPTSIKRILSKHSCLRNKQRFLILMNSFREFRLNDRLIHECRAVLTDFSPLKKPGTDKFSICSIPLVVVCPIHKHLATVPFVSFSQPFFSPASLQHLVMVSWLLLNTRQIRRGSVGGLSM